MGVKSIILIIFDGVAGEKAGRRTRGKNYFDLFELVWARAGGMGV